MEHFDIVLAVARIALDGDGVRAGHQLERLRDALSGSDKEQAAKIARLLSRNGRRHAMAPMGLDEMRATSEAAHRYLPGETLSPSTPLPHDRETSAPLARVLFPDALEPDPPILSTALAAAIEDLLNEWQRAEELRRIRDTSEYALFDLRSARSRKDEARSLFGETPQLTMRRGAARRSRFIFPRDDRAKYRRAIRFCKSISLRFIPR